MAEREYAVTTQVVRGTAEEGYEQWVSMCRLSIDTPLGWSVLARLRQRIADDTETDITQVAILSCIELEPEEFDGSKIVNLDESLESQ